MIYLSASAIKDYITCPARYYYRRYRSGESKTTKEMMIGNGIHAMIENYPKDEDGGLNNVITFSQENRLPIDDIISLAKSYYRNFSYMLGDGDRLEENFKIKYGEDVYLVGKWDAVLSSGVVVDWKTGKSKPFTISNDPQFILYHHAYSIVFGRNPVTLLYASLYTGEFVEYKHNIEYENLLINDTIPSMIRNISKEDYPRNGLFDRYACRYCSYKDACWNELDSGNLHNQFKKY